jgi:hypothetical protein
MNSSEPILAFCHLRKTGGVSFNQFLRRQHGTAHLETIVRFEKGTKRNRPFYRCEDLERDRWIYPRIKSIAGHYLCPAIDYGPIGRQFRWITILRDPLRRYISHYGQHVEKMGETYDFETFMSIEKHRNDQVKTIAGQPDLEKAKRLLETQFVVGFLESYELSLQVFRQLLPEFQLAIDHHQLSNPSKGIIDARQLAERYGERIRAHNQLDQQLYDFAHDVIWPRQLAGLDPEQLRTSALQQRTARPTLAQQLRWGLARLKRNILYKPYVRFGQRRWN